MSLINPSDSLERQNEKLLQIAHALMRKVEQKHEDSGIAYAQFERAALLEVQVRERTADLERTLDLLQKSNAQLATANVQTEIAQANLTEAIETINEGFALFDTNDRLVLSNSRFCRDLCDISKNLHEGMAFDDYVTVISQSRFLALPEDMTAEAWATARHERHRDDHVVFNVSLTQDRWLQISEHRTARGGTVILQTDVTNIIRLERLERDRMRDKQAQTLQATLDHLNQGVCIFDHEKKLVGWNKRMDRLLDLPPHQSALRLPFLTLLERLEHQLEFSADFDVDMLKRWAEHGAGRTAIAFEVTRSRNRILSVFGQEMPDRGFVISFTDVTVERESVRALAEMNERLEKRVQHRTHELGLALSEAKRANASKSRFVAAASHDLLQPLSAAKLFVASLADQIGETDLLNIANKAETALSSVEHIIEALLDISKLDSNEAVFDIKPVRLSALLRPLRDELTPVAMAKGLDLRILECGLTVCSDPGYLRRIVQNLISNAIRYTDKGRVIVGVRRVGGMARIEVWDTGCGISQADQHVVFQEFKRLDARTSHAGLGLGLAIVERACKSLDHPLRLWSEPGKGSCFSFDLPIRYGTEIQERSTAGRLGENASVRKGLVVLLVENDLQLANALIMMIEGWDAHVIHAPDGETALQLLSEIRLAPDALVLDYQLGSGMSGIELLKHLKKDFGNLPVRLVSANRGQDLQNECDALDVTLLAKPIDRERLYQFLSHLR